MTFTTSLLPPASNSSQPPDRQCDVAVVIDVLRATSVMATALSAGAREIMTCREVAIAFDLAADSNPIPLLCGERSCRRIDGFDLGNSPAEYVEDRVRDRRLILTTTNGTRAIESVDSVPVVVTASFLNLSSIVRYLADFGRVHLVCAGTEGVVTLEDTLLAGAILWKYSWQHGAEPMDDASNLAMQLWRSWFLEDVQRETMPSIDQLSERFRESRGGKNLLQLGFDDDLKRCAAIDSLDVVPARIKSDPATFALQG